MLLYTMQKLGFDLQQGTSFQKPEKNGKPHNIKEGIYNASSLTSQDDRSSSWKANDYISTFQPNDLFLVLLLLDSSNTACIIVKSIIINIQHKSVSSKVHTVLWLRHLWEEKKKK